MNELGDIHFENVTRVFVFTRLSNNFTTTEGVAICEKKLKLRALHDRKVYQKLNRKAEGEVYTPRFAP